MADHIPSSPSFSVSEKPARYGSSTLSGLEHLTLLVGSQSIAGALIRHFRCITALSRASTLELRQFLPKRRAEAVSTALGTSPSLKPSKRLSDQLDNPERIYKACADAGVRLEKPVPTIAAALDRDGQHRLFRIANDP